MPCAFRIDVAHFLWENIAMPTAGYRDACSPSKVTQNHRGEARTFQLTGGFWNIFWCLHPGRWTWNLRIRAPWKRKIISQTIIFRFYVNLRRCGRGNLVAQFRPSQKSFMLFEMPWRFRFLRKWLWIPNKTRKSTQKITQEKGSTPLNQQLNSTLLIFLKNRRLGFLFWWAFWLLCVFFCGGWHFKNIKQVTCLVSFSIRFPASRFQLGGKHEPWRAGVWPWTT